MLEQYVATSFFARKKILIVVPHQDDEINLMGGLLPLLVEAECDVHLVYATNGDYSFETGIRVKEAIEAVKRLGILKTNICFLGYPDSSRRYGSHIYYANLSPLGVRGKNVTSGVSYHPEFCYQKEGVHHSLTCENLLMDMKNVLLDVQADIIFCVDNDIHSDHVATSLVFEKALGEIIFADGNTYWPFVFKGFTYGTAWNAQKDFYNYPMLPTLKPNKVTNYDVDGELDNPYYSWDERLRFPVSKRAIIPLARQNVLTYAMLAHKSQIMIGHLEQIINSDVVFWQRHVCFWKYVKTIKVSSGEVKFLQHFNLFDVGNIGDEEEAMDFNNSLFKFSDGDVEKRITFSFSESINLRGFKFFFGIYDELEKPEVFVNGEIRVVNYNLEPHVLVAQNFFEQVKTIEFKFGDAKKTTLSLIEFITENEDVILQEDDNYGYVDGFSLTDKKVILDKKWVKLWKFRNCVQERLLHLITKIKRVFE